MRLPPSVRGSVDPLPHHVAQNCLCGADLTEVMQADQSRQANVLGNLHGNPRRTAAGTPLVERCVSGRGIPCGTPRAGLSGRPDVAVGCSAYGISGMPMSRGSGVSR